MRQPFALVGAAALLSLSSCGRTPDTYYPLAEGAKWTYRLRAGFVERVEEVRVVRKLSVDGVAGWELNGPMGPSRLAWSRGRLVAESAPGARFDPPIPLLDASGAESKWSWPASGEAYLTSNGRTAQAAGEGTQRKEDMEVGGRTFKTLRSTVTVRAGGKVLELDTWFAPGIGPLRQEQRLDGVLVAALERVSGP